MIADNPPTDVAAVTKNYLHERFPGLGELRPDTPLLSSGALDSLGVLDLMMFLGERFGIDLEDGDFVPENLETPALLEAFVRARARL